MSQGPSTLGRFFSELRRRRVFRTAAWYIVGSWLALQVADVVFPALDIPEQSIRYLLYACVLGFPVALVFGWFFDISTDGIHRTGPATAGELRTRQPLGRRDFLLLGALACVLGAVLYGTLTNVTVAPGQVAEAPPARAEGPPMVAVLPFANMSADDNGAFFAKGVHDDLLTQLAQIASLRVISRTSVLDYEGTTKSIPQIGRELGADVVLEGGIQLAGEEMRINAQLIDARTDEHLWAETFDRDLSAGSIFKVQSEIARAIANALQATLSTAEAAGLDVIPTENMAAYRAYHEAMRFAEENHLDRTTNRPIYRAGLQKAIDLDPTFTWPILELLGNIALGNFQEQDPNEIAQVEGMIEDIRRLKPDSFELLTAQGYYAYYILKDYDLALRLIGQARARNPSNARLLDIQGWIQRRNNDLEGSLESSRLALQLEPGNGSRIQFVLGRLQMLHRYAEALAFAEAQPRLNGSAQLIRSMLRVKEHHDLVRHRAELLEIMETGEDLRFYDRYWLWQAHMLLGEYESAASVVSNMDDPYRYQGEPLERLSLSQALFLLQAIIMQDEAAMATQAEQARVSLGLQAADGTALEPSPGPDKESQALIHIAEGDFVRAVELLQQGYREAARADPIAFIQARSNFCQGYGMAGAAELAVACIREGLVEPSMMAPFFEPLLPFYDRIRDSAPFQELLTELQADGWL